VDGVNNGELLTLKDLAANRAGFARSALFDRVASLLFEGEGELSPEVRVLIDQILTGLIHHVESDVRQKVARRIASLTSAPHELIKFLANDSIDIAEPVLNHSPVLTSADLIAVIGCKTTAHREAIARRAEVPADVCAALVVAQEPAVVEALLANVGAAIPRDVFGDLVALSKAVESIRDPLLSRQDMPKDLAHEMFWFVSAALRHTILEKFAIDPKELDAVFADVLTEAQGDAPHLHRQERALWSAGEVAGLIAKMRTGDLRGFTAGLAQVMGVEVPVAERVVGDAGGEALAIACRAIGADWSQFTTILRQLDYARSSSARPAANVQSIAKIYDLVSKDKAVAAISLWNVQSAAHAA